MRVIITMLLWVFVLGPLCLYMIPYKLAATAAFGLLLIGITIYLVTLGDDLIL